MKDSANEKTEFWEASFIEKQEMWGLDPANSTAITTDIFVQNAVKKVLIPGIGYGRNARPFLESGMSVTGIEISETAIELLKKHYGTQINVYHGSVTDMPFDELQYDGIFCYALIHLLHAREREKLIRDCYNQLPENGCMIFTAISKEASTYGTGKLIGKDRYEQFGGVNIFFYDHESIRAEFGAFGLVDIREVMENQPMFLVTCRKTS
ncbi:MAG: Methyltransferase type 11 [Fluviicola sp.]|jgi:SAM-dependent methyltransferase|uniref:class I SAM-dependent methyltransferase n=1 Tax=Fluviicola sp. TaxID=1917219 RepID=UPI00261F8B96|nr:class I SAM-dependent methyltransferase [Fluviicola sp.]MDF3029012.1 Methyltransferase type 11 [Fluviicola sp.]